MKFLKFKEGAVTRKCSTLTRSVPFLQKSKKGDIEWDQIGKILIALVALIILIYIITQVIGGELGSQGDKVKDAVDFLG